MSDPFEEQQKKEICSALAIPVSALSRTATAMKQMGESSLAEAYQKMMDQLTEYIALVAPPPMIFGNFNEGSEVASNTVVTTTTNSEPNLGIIPINFPDGLTVTTGPIRQPKPHKPRKRRMKLAPLDLNPPRRIRLVD